MSTQPDAAYMNRIAAPPHPAAPADAGDAMRVATVMEKEFGNLINEAYACDSVRSGDRIREKIGAWAFDHQAEIADALAAARRLLDAPPGVGERLHDALRDLFAFVTVMHGDEDGNVPAMVRTPIGALAKLGEIMADARAALAAPAPAEAAREWISVKERLPEGGGFVIVFCESSWRTLAAWRMGRWYDDRDMYLHGEVVCWQPLPDPPAPAASSAAEGSVATGEGGE